MDGEALVASEPFTYRRVRLHMIYSFCLAHGADPLNDADLRLIANANGWSRELPLERRGVISPFLAVNLPWAFKPMKLGEAVIDGQRLQVSALFRLFAIGGTLTLTFDLAREPHALSTKNAHSLFGATGLSYETQSGATDIEFNDRKYTSAYHLFQSLLHEERQALVDELSRPIDWHDVKSEVINLAHTDSDPIPQSPWSVTALEVDGSELQAFCTGTDRESVMTTEQKARRILPYLHDIGPILFRSVSGENFPIEPTYRGQEGGLDASLGTCLSSMHLDARMFVCSSRRNVVCIAKDFERDAGRYFLPGVLGINELVRARWHSLIILNRNLDRILGAYGETKDVGDFEPESQDKEVRSRRTMEASQLKDIITSRRWIARVLDDPGIYTIAGDALAALYARGKEIFALDELMTLLVRKADLIDRLHADEQQLAWTKRT